MKPVGIRRYVRPHFSLAILTTVLLSAVVIRPVDNMGGSVFAGQERQRASAPPADVGWLPRPHTMLVVSPVEHPHDPNPEEEGDTIDLEAAAPIEIDLVSRG